jgi:hypothetical protein
MTNGIVKWGFYPFLLIYSLFHLYFIIFYMFYLNPKVLTTLQVLIFANKKSRSETLNKDTLFGLFLYICRMYRSF